jgi:hypothetical protein
MDGCDARHNEEVLLCTIDRFVMAITPAEVMPRPALAIGGHGAGEKKFGPATVAGATNFVRSTPAHGGL